MSDELVRVRDLKKIFSVPAGELHAVDGVDFSIARGSTIGIVGESGCGKSTMGRLLAMLLEATSGEILFDGQNIAKKMSKAEAMAYKKRIQMIFQDPQSSLNERAKVSYIVGEGLMNVRPDLSAAEREAKVRQALLDVGLLPEFASRFPHEFSGGQRQRLMIARAIAPKPKILIFDEATSALDNITQKQVSDSLAKLKCTRIVVAHRLSTIKECDRIIVIDKGKIAEDGTFDELIARGGFFAELVERQRAEV